MRLPLAPQGETCGVPTSKPGWRTARKTQGLKGKERIGTSQLEPPPRLDGQWPPKRYTRTKGRLKVETAKRALLHWSQRSHGRQELRMARS